MSGPRPNKRKKAYMKEKYKSRHQAGRDEYRNLGVSGRNR